MKARIQRWGNSLALRIPQSLADEAHLTQQSVVELTMVGGELIISVTNEPDRTLDDLLALVTPENLHAEDEFGMPVGKEHW